MQLEKQIAFLKALGDPTRMKIVHLLSGSTLHGQAIAGKLGLTPPTISHHLTKLKESGVIISRRNKNTIYFELNKKMVKQHLMSILSLIEQEEREEVEEKEKILGNFIDQNGRLKTIPSQRKKKLIVLEYFAAKLELGRKYEEKEINEFIKQFHEDFATIRREFINHQFMYRDQGIYELNPREMWLN
ncbi:metalloregulator ArsR/SmtB family transcription factor [Jeotgalibacillus proteolyticus]|uniref:ArsR family transcriptional regulator n=1 Tax=Jeotgalibacillus proteolyticus TaxID=2082395 RepID=A0A2S5GHB3_9BACL|nr:metalloregulator ArsR/SmtB family transcription factor [Jeotgalibacillus proteolyticus]PPA72243.1 ArsR family transcriptional regulator [Jeotgalibacillus proteolyticus]